MRRNPGINRTEPEIAPRSAKTPLALAQAVLVFFAGLLAPAVLLAQRPAAQALQEAAAALQQGDFARARLAAERATLAEPRSATAWKFLGMAFAAEDRLEEAYLPFSRACDYSASEPGACYYQGRTAYFLSRLPEAEAAFRKASRVPADRPRAILGLASVMEASSKPEQADELFRQALQAKAEGALREYGMFLFRQGRHTEAVNALEKAGATEDLARVRKELAAAPKTKAIREARPPIQFSAFALPMVVQNHASGNKHLVETMMGGLCAFDFDNDGHLDLYVTNGASLPSLQKSGDADANRLFRNRGDGEFVDVTNEAGVAGRGYAMAAAAGDYDGDGFLDLFVAGVRENILYRNRGDGHFEDVTQRAGVAGDGKWSVGAAWFDYDRDGRLDLFVARYVEWDPAAEPYCGDRKPGRRTYCHPRLYGPLHNLLYRNEGEGRFRDVSVEAGLASHLGKAMGLAVADFDNDGWLDVFVGNDALPNFLFLNRGGRFEEVATESGVALPNDGRPVSSMGAGIGDIDEDGQEDLVISALSNETFPLFRNLGGAAFQDITAPSGLAALALPYSGWGVGFADFDNDGLPDVFSANGHVMDNAELTSSRASKQPNTVFRNLGAGRFALQIVNGDGDGIPVGEAFHRGAAFGDFNRDGRMDVAVSRLNEAPRILFNRTEAPGNWLCVHLPVDAIGARVRATSSKGVVWGRLAPHFSYASSSEHAVHLGLGDAAQVNELKLNWPDGCVQVLRDVPANQHLRIERQCGNEQPRRGNFF
jgi:tetratricopeptide (TPR) repeat protein